MALGYMLTISQVLAYYDPACSALAPHLARAAAGRALRMQDYGALDDAPPEAITADAPTAFREHARRYLEKTMPGCLPDATPRRYPAFHGAVRGDLVLDIDDKQSQRACFERGRRVLEFLERYQAPYRLKYSGNCSMHFVIPEEAYRPLMPADRWEELCRHFRLWAMEQCGTQVDTTFTTDDHPLRLPYSLHERTGLVSIPVDAERYDAFHPEMAELPNVVASDAWFRTDDLVAKQGGMQRMLREALGDDHVL